YLQRPNYPQQYSITPQQAVYVNNWNNFNTPPPQSANGYYPPHGMSNFQSLPHQLPPQQLPAQQPPAQHRKGDKAIPIIDPKTGKNVLNDKNCEETVTRPNMDKEVENSDPSVCVQFATQVAAVLNEPTSKPVETARVPDSQTVLCPSENETAEETVDIELVERAELVETESSDEYIESSNITVNEKGPLTIFRKETDKNSINEHTYENISTQIVDSAPVSEQRVVSNVNQVSSEELFQSEAVVVEKEAVKIQDSNSNVEPSVAFSEINRNNAELIIEPDSSNNVQESIPAKETVIPTSSIENSGSNTSAVSSKIQEKVLGESKLKSI
ncbi:eukaryotic translation initiation factor 4 gamma 3, partial [Trichonephila clavata]